MIKLIFTAICLAFVYTLLIAAMIGLVVMALPIELHLEKWGGLLVLLLFMVLMYPANKVAKSMSNKSHYESK